MNFISLLVCNNLEQILGLINRRQGEVIIESISLYDSSIKNCFNNWIGVFVMTIQ